ncbi:MAG: NAD(P)/FAD-dependent oxidoreductase [Caldilineaceae bacterium]|nr:NAD(P)/FAD-dependent oxidoreductase [Caldilineaceae bacterium]
MHKRHSTRRFILGGATGLIMAALAVAVLRLAAAGGGITVADVGGVFQIVVTGALLGLSGAAFLPREAPPAEQIIYGCVLGIVAWVVLALNIYPVLMGRGPMWQAAAVMPYFPHLVAYTLLGGTTGLLYGVLFVWLAGPLQLVPPPMDVPEIKLRVVILGGGYAGVTAAQTLEKELKGDPSAGIWLVSNTNFLLHTPMLSEVSASAVRAENISPPLRSFFRNVQVVQGAVERVDLAERTLYLAPDGRSPARQLPFDHLIVTVGSVPHFFGTRGVAEHALTFKSLEDAELIRNQIIDMFERADFEADPATRRRLLTFVVAGGGFAGVELIGGLNDFARGIAPFYPNVRQDEIRPVLIHARETILPELSESLGKYAQEKLAQRGVEFKLGVRCTGVEPGKVFLSDGEIEAETFIWTAGNKPNPVLAMLGVPLTDRGQIAVNQYLAVADVPGLWAAGDCAQVPDVVTGAFAPPTAQHALREGKVVGHNVAAAIQGKALEEFAHKSLGSLAALGHQLAVAEVFGYRFSGFLAWVMWRSIYLLKLPTLARQVRVGLDWALDIFFPPDIVQTIDFSRARAGQEKTQTAPNGTMGQEKPARGADEVVAVS